MSSEPRLACDPGAIPPDRRDRHEAAATTLFASTLRHRETPDGYRFRFPGDPETIRTAAEFVADERRCCPFLDFTLEVPGGEGPLSLTLEGRAGVKRYLRETLIARLEEL